jgi:hypothetical protein
LGSSAFDTRWRAWTSGGAGKRAAAPVSPGHTGAIHPWPYDGEYAEEQAHDDEDAERVTRFAAREFGESLVSDIVANAIFYAVKGRVLF